MKRMIFPAAALVLLAACSGSDDPTNIAIDEGNALAQAESMPADEAGSEPAPPLPPRTGDPAGDNGAVNEADDAGSEQPSPPGTPEASMIPSQYRGRWGLVAADCEQGRSDAKGLMTIGEKSIRFYESTATLKEKRPAIATSFSGLFGFTGEGQTWQKVMTFTRTGDMLKRAETDGTYNYRRCR